jgi:hypothetical protein
MATLSTSMMAALMAMSGEPHVHVQQVPTPRQHSTSDAGTWHGFETASSETAKFARKPTKLPDSRSLATRPTTAREDIIGEMREWALWESNWDGEGGNRPDASSVRDATLFVNLLAKGMPLPEPMLHSTGRAGLYWNQDGLYADLEFLGNRCIAYYVERQGEDKHKGVIKLRKEKMPDLFSALIGV